MNCAGVFIAVVLFETYGVLHRYNSPLYFRREFVLFVGLSALGILQALAGSAVIAFVRIRNRTVRIGLGVIIGVIAAVFVLMLGMTFLWVYALLAFWVFLPSGILFGWLLTRSSLTSRR